MKIIRLEDGKIEYIKFVDDGIAIKLTAKGIIYGSDINGALRLAEDVKLWDAKLNQRGSFISTYILAADIEAHCLAYIGCDYKKISATKACIDIKRHANPVNPSWRLISSANEIVFNIKVSVIEFVQKDTPEILK